MRLKAIVRERYGPPGVLQLKEVEKPTPAEGRVLVRVRAASLNKTDHYDLHPPTLIRLIAGQGLLKPKSRSMGSDLAGVVESAGAKVERLKPGDEVFGSAPGALAEYASAREDRLALKPAGVSFEEAAAVPIAAVTALQGLRDWGHVRPGQKVLIYGASGGVGTFAVQLAKWFGTEVTAVCSARNVEQAIGLGADHVVDYEKEDFGKNGEKYDLILQINGAHSLLGYRRALTQTGVYRMVGAINPIPQMMKTIVVGGLLSRSGGKSIGFMGIAKMNQRDLELLGQLMQEGKVKPVVERVYAFSDVAEAFRHLDEGHARGKLVVRV